MICGTIRMGAGAGGALLTEPIGASGDDWDSCAMTWFALAVPDAPQTGQVTSHGMRPFTGSASNLIFCPQSQWILISMMAPDMAQVEPGV